MTRPERRRIMRTVTESNVLADQIAYYRARAGEYDEWWFRTGRYDRGAEFNAHGSPKRRRSKPRSWPGLRQRPATCSSSPAAPACSRGCSRLASATHRDRRIARGDRHQSRAGRRRQRRLRRSGSVRVAARAALRRVFMSFWLSHVPDRALRRVLGSGCAALAPGGAVYLIDSALDPTSTAKDHVLPDARPASSRASSTTAESSGSSSFSTPATLAAKLKPLGWQPILRRRRATSSTESTCERQTDSLR